jgi:hypothetical protein
MSPTSEPCGSSLVATARASDFFGIAGTAAIMGCVCAIFTVAFGMVGPPVGATWMRAVSFLGAAFNPVGTAAAEGTAAAAAGVTGAAGTGGIAGTDGFGASPGGFGGMPEGATGFTAGREPDGGSGFGAPSGAGALKAGGAGIGGTLEGAAGGAGLIGAVATRVVSFLGVAAIGVMRMVCPFKLLSYAGSVTGAAGAGGGGGTEPKRTVSRFTPVASPGFEGSVIRTVSFLGTVPGVGVPEGFSSAIIIRFSFSISLLRIYVNSIVHWVSLYRKGTFACSYFNQSATLHG